MRNLKLVIEGMHCGGCVNRVTMALNKIPAVEVRSVEVGSAEVSFDETQLQPEAIAAAVGKLGFPARIEG